VSITKVLQVIAFGLYTNDYSCDVRKDGKASLQGLIRSQRLLAESNGEKIFDIRSTFGKVMIE